MRFLLLVVSLIFSLSSFVEASGPTPEFEIMTGKAAEEKIRLLFDGANTQNPFLFKGTNPEGKACTLSFYTPSESEFIVSLSQELNPGEQETQVSKVIITKAATLSRATRSFDSYNSELYKLFIPSGGFDILEYRKRHDASEYQLVVSSSMDQKKWFACGQFKL